MLVKEFRKKLNRGLGSVILLLRSLNKNNRRYTQAIIYACVHDTSYDPQCDESKAQYLWEVIQLSEDSGMIQDKVLEALCTTENGWDLIQIYELARLFYANGNVKAKKTMMEQFKYNESHNAFIGAEQIIDIDGLEGLSFVMESIGERTLFDGYCEDDYLLEFAKEKLGEGNVLSFLESESQSNSKIKAYVDSVNLSKDIHNDAVPKDIFSYDYLKQKINEYKGGSAYYLGRWGRRTSEVNFLKAAEEFLNKTDNKEVIPYLYIFSRKAFPLNPERIMDLALSTNKYVSNAALEALCNIKEQRIHEVAMDLIKKHGKELNVLPLLIKNYEDNDYLILKELIFKKNNKHSFHYISGLIMDILENNKVRESTEMLIEIYYIGQCTTCRKRCIEIMIKHGVLPNWIAEEAEFDSNLEIRQLIFDYKNSGIHMMEF